MLMCLFERVPDALMPLDHSVSFLKQALIRLIIK